MSEARCRTSGCGKPLPSQLLDQGVCLEHYLAEVETRINGYNRQLSETPGDPALGSAVLQFILLTAARIATVGVQAPPSDQMVRGRMLHVMLMLADLRERLDAAKKT